EKVFLHGHGEDGSLVALPNDCPDLLAPNRHQLEINSVRCLPITIRMGFVPKSFPHCMRDFHHRDLKQKPTISLFQNFKRKRTEILHKFDNAVANGASVSWI